MSMIVNTTAFSKVLRVLAGGEFDLEEAKRTFLEVIDAIDENRSEKVLFDGRDVSGNPTIVERFYYGEFAAEIVNSSRQDRKWLVNPQFAYVLVRPVLDPLRLGETVAANRGMNVKVFDNLDDAVKWLELAPEEVSALIQHDLTDELR